MTNGRTSFALSFSSKSGTRVELFERRTASSWVHDFLADQDRQEEYRSNQPESVRFVSPTVTLLEKLEAISRLHARHDFDPAGFIRHYEDVRRILESGVDLAAVAALATNMLEAGDIRQIPSAGDPAFDLASDESKGAALRAASKRLTVMFWGERGSLEDCCRTIRDFLRDLNVTAS